VQHTLIVCPDPAVTSDGNFVYTFSMGSAVF
jgi:hypothetical protein